MLSSQTRRRLAEWIPLFRSSRPRGERSANRPHGGRTRSLRMEPLEQRALLSVSGIGTEKFKDLGFTATGNVVGAYTVDVQGQQVQISASGKGTLADLEKLRAQPVVPLLDGVERQPLFRHRGQSETIIFYLEKLCYSLNYENQVYSFINLLNDFNYFRFLYSTFSRKI